MKAVILCGGQGTGFRDVADDISTPMIRIGVRSILRTDPVTGINDFALRLVRY